MKDKAWHAFVNFILAAVAGIFSYPLAFGLCIGASIGKEVGDALAKGKNWNKMDSFFDLIADAFGAMVGIIIAWTIRNIG